LMFVLYSKDKRQSQDNQDKAVKTKKVQRANKKKIPPGAWMVLRCECCLCCQVEVCATG
jgi:hypothetical protein